MVDLLGILFPPDPSKLGRVPQASILRHRIDIGEVKVIELQEQGVATNVLEWVGYKWVPRQNGQDENRLDF